MRPYRQQPIENKTKQTCKRWKDSWGRSNIIWNKTKKPGRQQSEKHFERLGWFVRASRACILNGIIYGTRLLTVCCRSTYALLFTYPFYFVVNLKWGKCVAMGNNWWREVNTGQFNYSCVNQSLKQEKEIIYQMREPVLILIILRNKKQCLDYSTRKSQYFLAIGSYERTQASLDLYHQKTITEVRKQMLIGSVWQQKSGSQGISLNKCFVVMLRPHRIIWHITLVC